MTDQAEGGCPEEMRPRGEGGEGGGLEGARENGREGGRGIE